MIQFNNTIDGGFNGKPCKLAETTPYAKKKIIEAEEWAEKERDKYIDKLRAVSDEIKNMLKDGKDVSGKEKELKEINESLQSITPKYYKMIGDVMLQFNDGEQDIEFYKDDNFPESTFWGLYHFFLKPWSRMNSQQSTS